MSKAKRRGEVDGPPWHPARTMEILDLMDRNRLIGEVMAECARLSGGGGALEEAKYNFWVRAFAQMQPEPGQLPDTALTDTVITKRTTGAMRFFGRSSEIRKERWGTLCRFAMNCLEAPPAKLRQAFEKV